MECMMENMKQVGDSKYTQSGIMAVRHGFLTKLISLMGNELKVHFRHYTKSLASFCGLMRVFLFYLLCYYRKQQLNKQRKLFTQEEARKDYAQQAMTCLQVTHWEYKQIPPNVFQQQGF